MRLIDKTEYQELLAKIPMEERTFRKAVEVAEDMPTIDAVPVVRCGECERRSKSADLTDTVYCPWLKQQMRKTDFCSYGE